MSLNNGDSAKADCMRDIAAVESQRYAPIPSWYIQPNQEQKVAGYLAVHHLVEHEGIALNIGLNQAYQYQPEYLAGMMIEGGNKYLQVYGTSLYSAVVSLCQAVAPTPELPVTLDPESFTGDIQAQYSYIDRIIQAPGIYRLRIEKRANKVQVRNYILDQIDYILSVQFSPSDNNMKATKGYSTMLAACKNLAFDLGI